MIKIKNTKTHTYLKYNQEKETWTQNVLVTDAKLVLVEEKLLTVPSIQVDGKIVKPILISETEKIEVGDWVLHWDNRVLEKAIDQKLADHYSIHNDAYSKILALPEHFSPEHLQMIVDGKLKDGDKLLVECLLWNSSNSGNTAAILEDGFRANNEYVIKLNPHITIYPVKEKMVPISLLEKAFNAGFELESHNWHMQEFHGFNCSCVEPTYENFKQWLEQKVL